LPKGHVFSTVEAAKDGIETYARIVVGLGPQATLERGFVIVRDANDLSVTSRDAAMRSNECTVQFHDGSVPVTNREFVEGDNR
jgi:exodeoxyribonuclease VII large subunit